MLFTEPRHRESWSRIDCSIESFHLGLFPTSDGVCSVLFLVQKSSSAFSSTLCTEVSKKTKLFCFGEFFSLVFKNQVTACFLGVFYI
jgi:hypothetical protein